MTHSGGSTPPAAALQKARLPLVLAAQQSGIRRSGIYGTRDGRQSGSMPANLITLAHFSVSSTISLPKSEGIIGNRGLPI
jgi:hypothetical protein